MIVDDRSARPAVLDLIARRAVLDRAMTAWAALELRGLPWRGTRDPWAILVAESMLQQTQVARVVPRWKAFLERYADPRHCADAPQADIVRAWAGLGYNRRAVALHATATQIVQHHDGEVPSGLSELQALPGVGPYTARAVRAFAFEQPAAVLDTNVGRVLARLVGQRLRPAEAQSLADALVPDGGVWRWNQAVMELGALVCTKRAPGCDRCPVVAECGWQGRGDDPATGSAGVTAAQSRFEGSDRQARGRLVDALRRGPLAAGEIAEVAGIDDERLARVVDGLVNDGLARRRAGGLALR